MWTRAKPLRPAVSDRATGPLHEEVHPEVHHRALTMNRQPPQAAIQPPPPVFRGLRGFLETGANAWTSGGSLQSDRSEPRRNPRRAIRSPPRALGSARSAALRSTGKSLLRRVVHLAEKLPSLLGRQDLVEL